MRNLILVLAFAFALPCQALGQTDHVPSSGVADVPILKGDVRAAAAQIIYTADKYVLFMDIRMEEQKFENVDVAYVGVDTQLFKRVLHVFDTDFGDTLVYKRMTVVLNEHIRSAMKEASMVQMKVDDVVFNLTPIIDKIEVVEKKPRLP